MNGLLNNPLLSLGMGLLSGNQGATKGAAFSNAMSGGLLGLRDARRAAELQSMQQQRALQQQAMMQGMQAQKARQERERKAQEAFMIPGTAPEMMGPPSPTGQMELQPGLDSRAPQNQQELIQSAYRMMPYDFQTATSILNAVKPTGSQATSAMQNAAAMGLVPGTEAYNKYVRDVTLKPGTQIHIGDTKPMPLIDLTRLVDEEGNQPPVGISLPEIVASGKYRVATAQQQAEARKKESGMDVVLSLEDQLFGENGIYKDYPSYDSQLQNQMAWTVDMNKKYYDQSDPRVRATADYTVGTLAPIVKSLGEAGNLATEDIQRAEKLVPKLTGVNPDSPQTARRKLNQLKKLLQNKFIPAAKKAGADVDTILKGSSSKIGSIARPTTEAEYNALPSGALFINPDDGKQYRKP